MARIISRASVRVDAEADGLARRLNRIVDRAARKVDRKIHIDVDTRNLERGLQRLDRVATGLLSSLFSGKLIGSAATALRDYGAAAAAVAPALGALAAQSLTALQSLALLPAVAAAGAATIATLVIGVQGLDEAFKNMDNADKFNKALEDLAPSARNFARTIRDLREPFKQLRLGVQQQLFEGVGDSVDKLAKATLPALRNGLGGIADSLSDGFNMWAEYAASAEGVKNLETILGNTKGFLDELGPAGTDFAAALADIAAVGSEFLKPLGNSLKRAASQFRDFIAEAEKTGKLKEFIQEGLDAFERLWNLVMSVGRLIGTVFDGLAGDSGNLLVSMRQNVDALNAFLETAKGQEILQSLGDSFRAIGDAVRKVLGAAFRELGPVIVELTPFIVELAQEISGFLVAAIQVLAPLLKSMATFLSENKETIAPLVAGFLLVSKVGKVLAPVVRFLGKAIGFVAKHWKTIIKVFKINPWVALITTVITVTIAIIQNWDKVKKFLLKVWRAIKSTAISIWNGIGNFFKTWGNSVKTGFTDMWNRVTTFFSNAFNNIRNTASRGMSRIGTAVSNGIGNVVSFFRELPGKVLDAVVGFHQLLWRAGADLLRGLIGGIGSMIGEVISKVTDIGGQILGGIKSTLGISSPSKEMARIGRFSVEGLIKGLSDMGPQLDKQAAKLGDTVTGAARSRIRLTGPGGVVNGSAAQDRSGGGTLVQNNYMQPGTDVRQFASAVLQRGASAALSGGGTRTVSRKGVQAGVDDQAVEGVRL